MSSITKEQLRYLAKLTALKLSDEDLEKMLPQMEQIIAFVGKLQELDLETGGSEEGQILQLREGVKTDMDREVFFKNITHPITNDMITIETSTNQKKG